MSREGGTLGRVVGNVIRDIILLEFLLGKENERRFQGTERNNFYVSTSAEGSLHFDSTLKKNRKTVEWFRITNDKSLIK